MTERVFLSNKKVTKSKVLIDFFLSRQEATFRQSEKALII